MNPIEGNPVYFVGGINGTGKSRLVGEISQTVPDLEVVSGSERFMAYLGVEKGDYNTLRGLPDEYKDRMASQMYQELIEKRQKGLLIDAQYLLIKEGVVHDICPSWVGLVTAFVLIKVPPEPLLEWIERDEEEKGRNRRLFTPGLTWAERINELKIFSYETTKKALEWTKWSNTPLLELENGPGTPVSDLVKKFVAFHEQVTRKEAV